METVKSLKEARRLARAVVSDIATYHPLEVETGFKNDTLFELLKEPIGLGHTHFVKMLAPNISEAKSYYDDALVDILFCQQAKHYTSTLF